MLRRILQTSLLIGCLVISQIIPGFVPTSNISKNNDTQVPQAEALGTFLGTAGNLVVGTQTAISSGAATGNTGSYKATYQNDSYVWTVNSNASTGLNQQITMGNARLRNANVFVIQAAVLASVATLNRSYQICDWTSAASVDNAADTECTGGGWRTLNKTDGSSRASITNTTKVSFEWRLYDGYFTTSLTGNTSVSTPLSNFISGGNTILIRAYSTSAVAATHTWDYVSVSPVIDSTYFPAGFTQLNGGSVTSSYINSENPVGFPSGTTGTMGDDSIFLSVPGTSGLPSEFYLSHKGVRTYTGANTIVLTSDITCSTTGINVTPKIYNFTTASWTSLTSAITCTTSNALTRVALNNITVNDYISNGELRIGYFGSANSTVAIRIDYEYVMIGSVNNDSSKCEISFGSGTATGCTNTRDYNSTGAVTSWTLNTELESAAMSHDYYPRDNDGDAVSAEAGFAANVSVPITMSPGMQLVSFGYLVIGRPSSTSTGLNLGFGVRNYDLNNYGTSNDAWAMHGTSFGGGTAYAIFDPFTTLFYFPNAAKEIDTVNNLANIKFNSPSSTATTNQTPEIDFAMLSPRWVEDTVKPRTTIRSTYAPTAGALINGAQTAISSAAATGNTGSWKGTISDTGYGWFVTSTAGATLDQELTFGNVRQNGANKINIYLRAQSGNASLTRFYQICDWVSSTNVDNIADTECTTGGWRTLNKTNGTSRAAITTIAATAYQWLIYDGYFTTSLTGNTPVSTPVSNFISSSGNVLIRAHGGAGASISHNINNAIIEVAVSPVYSAGGFTQLDGGTVTTSYINTENPPTLISGETSGTGADNIYLSVPGTAAKVADFYLSYKNIKTYSDMNAILVRSEYSCSTAAGVNIIPEIYNFNSASWEALTSTTIACATGDVTNQFVKGNITVSNYISSGELRVRWRTSAVTTSAIRIDTQYVMLGSVNSDNSKCEISFGTGTASNCSNTRDYDSLGTPSAWTIASELESTTMAHDYYPFDNNADADALDHAVSANISFPTTLPDYAIVSSLSYAEAFQSGSTLLTLTGQLKDIASPATTVGLTGGWFQYGVSSAAAAYTYGDSITQSNPVITLPTAFLDTVLNSVKARIRTSASTLVSSANSLIDFMMIAPHWVEGPTVQSLSFSISDNTIGFGTLSSANARYATGNLSGSTTEVEAHTLTATTNAASGYSIAVNGTTLTSGANTITAIGAVNSASSPGTEQFGLRATASGGTGAVSAPYAASGFAFDTATFPDEVANEAVGDSVATTYSVRYIANMANGSEPGNYSSVLTYTVTANY